MPACFHITSFAIIEELLTFSRYRPENSEPANGDSGMNAFLVGAPAMFGQQFGARGAQLYFDWDGPVQSIPQSLLPPITPPAVLYDQLPWRVFVRGPVTEKMLRLTSARPERIEGVPQQIVLVARGLPFATRLRHGLFFKRGKALRVAYLRSLRRRLRERECWLYLA